MGSPIDILFEQIYGYSPKKAGEAYEILSASVMKLLENKSLVAQDRKLRGSFSKTLYQLDVYMQNENNNKMGEAKDYTVQGNKVGRPDLQKLGGALGDLEEIKEGLFFSATDYTKPAIKYAEASKQILGKEIKLYDLRPSTKVDEEGRIMSILIKILFLTPIFEKGTFEPIFSSSGNKTITTLLDSGQLKEDDMKVSVGEFYDEQGKVVSSIMELTSHDFGGGFEKSAIGSFYLNGLHINVSGHLIELHGLTYEIPFSEITETIEINAHGNPKLLIKDQFGNIDKLITDEELNLVINEVLDHD